MPHLEFSVRRVILASGFALAVAAAPAVAAFAVPVAANAAPAASCPAGEDEDMYSGSCLPHTVPNSPTNNGGVAAALDQAPAGLPAVDGVPCTGENTGTCIGLQENAPQFVQPPTSVNGG